MAKVSKQQRAADSATLERRSLQVQRGGARAAVLGVNDGLVSTLAIVLAVAGAGASQEAVQLAGFAGLIAGAVSMAAGEWISVRSQVELFQGILSDLKSVVVRDKELLVEKLKQTFVSTGFSEPSAQKAVVDLAKDEAHLHEAYASRVMGMNTDELGSPWVAAGSSFLLFTAGALVALLPWFLLSGQSAIWGSLISTSIGGLVSGGYVAYSSGNNIPYGAVRQFLIVMLAAGVTYGVGYLFGVNIA